MFKYSMQSRPQKNKTANKFNGNLIFKNITGCLFVCMSVAKDLDNRRTDIALIHNVFFISPVSVYFIFLITPINKLFFQTFL